jgi:hypothetical protein
MNGNDHFEQQLQRQAFRPVPAAWREEVLSAAHAASVSPAPPLVTPHGLLAELHGRLTAWLWPHPVAWAGLGGVWLLVLGFAFAGGEPSQPTVARSTVPPSPQMRELLKEQKQWLVELAGPNEPPEPERPKVPAPQPRSQRREEFLRA